MRQITDSSDWTYLSTETSPVIDELNKMPAFQKDSPGRYGKPQS
jgi:hypothetical protein